MQRILCNGWQLINACSIASSWLQIDRWKKHCASCIWYQEATRCWHFRPQPWLMWSLGVMFFKSNLMNWSIGVTRHRFPFRSTRWYEHAKSNGPYPRTIWSQTQLTCWQQVTAAYEFRLRQVRSGSGVHLRLVRFHQSKVAQFLLLVSNRSHE